MRIRFVLPVVLAFTFSMSAMATEKVLCVVSSDIDSDIGKIVVEMDQDDRGIEHLYQDSYHDSKLTARIELKADDLRSGIVLNRKDKYITVRMHSDNFDQERGGVLFLDTLYSGISGERKEYEMQLAIDKTGPILIQNKQNFSKMNFVAKRSKVFGVIGIEKVVFGN
ncbi:MAG: hypothetical protein H7281_18535 [Bacteriovorax sp.]|nr:hypothetical protein [Bacteriovorax sp.]